MQFPVLSLCLLLTDPDVGSQLPPSCFNELEPSESISQPNTFFYKLPWPCVVVCLSSGKNNQDIWLTICKDQSIKIGKS